MKKNLLTLALAAALCCPFFNTAFADEFVQNADATVRVEKPSTPSNASNATFTGAVKHLSLFGTTDETTYTGSYVIFSPGSRSFWHTHPGGQRLIVVKGTLWTGTWDGEKTIAHEGDSVWCPVGVKHWHGAPPDEECVQMTLTEMRDSKNVTWMEAVSDEQYNAK